MPPAVILERKRKNLAIAKAIQASNPGSALIATKDTITVKTTKPILIIDRIAIDGKLGEMKTLTDLEWTSLRRAVRGKIVKLTDVEIRIETTRTEFLALRLLPQEKEFIEKAALRQGKTLTDYARETLLAKAKADLEVRYTA